MKARPIPARGRRDERTLVQLMNTGDQQARDELTARYLPFARALAMRYRRGGEPIDDLVQVAVLGLLKAIARWDPDRGVELRSYAAPAILGELRRYFRDCTWGVRPPRRLQELSYGVERAREALQTQLGRAPTLRDLAGALNRCEEDVVEALEARGGRFPDSLDAPASPASDDGVGSRGELIPSIDHELERVEARVTVERLARILDPRAREILRLRFAENLAQAEIAAQIGCSQMHVSRIIRSSLEKLQDYASRVSVGPAPPRSAYGAADGLAVRHGLAQDERLDLSPQVTPHRSPEARVMARRPAWLSA